MKLLDKLVLEELCFVIFNFYLKDDVVSKYRQLITHSNNFLLSGGI